MKAPEIRGSGGYATGFRARRGRGGRDWQLGIAARSIGQPQATERTDLRAQRSEASRVWSIASRRRLFASDRAAMVNCDGTPPFHLFELRSEVEPARSSRRGRHAVVSLGDADELPSGKKVKWMRHAYKARARVRRACSSC